MWKHILIKIEEKEEQIYEENYKANKTEDTDETLKAAIENSTTNEMKQFTYNIYEKCHIIPYCNKIFDESNPFQSRIYVKRLPTHDTPKSSFTSNLLVTEWINHQCES